ncbi:hypothetical protein F5148DRAFT_1182393 [Russula earlei]|uniref:Uncharacterized protein n=1 Tax=Russula earlei TaxID=71964 RepID=A0ACC0UEE5_9AGAM|nr:hypothetical protein F5148DRAFT_1182393 [Russula earlei]
MTMLIGLLRCAHKSPNGIWKLLYQHCIIWIVLALITEIPTVVFLILNLNDAWNEMLNGAAIAIISIGAARMYRSLSINGSLTEYPLTSDLPKFSAPSLNTSASARTRNVHESIQLATIARSERHPTMYGAPVYVTADYAQVEFAPSVSNTTLVPESASSEATSSRHETI